MMENTLENKARFIAQYWGHKVILNSSVYMYVGSESMRRIEPAHYLELKPLLSITDEDAIEVANLQFPVQPLFKKLDEDLILNDTAEYLRSKGYALPFIGLSIEQLIEYGWIKLTENGKNN